MQKKITPVTDAVFYYGQFFVSIVCWWSALGLIANWLVR